jgi:hypothetical protein
MQFIPVVWCGRWDLNPRIPKEQGYRSPFYFLTHSKLRTLFYDEPCAVGQAWQPPQVINLIIDSQIYFYKQTARKPSITSTIILLKEYKSFVCQSISNQKCIEGKPRRVKEENQTGLAS